MNHPNMPVEELDDVQQEEISAADALARIHAGEELTNVTVRDLRLSGEFAVPVRLRHAKLINLQTHGAQFHEPVELLACTLLGPTFGKGTRFHQGLRLEGSKMRKFRLRKVEATSLRLDNTQCTGKFIIDGCTFEGDVRLWDACFRGWVEFRYSKFLGQADFRSFHAEQGVNVTDSQFHQDVLWRGCDIAKKLDLSNSQFEKLVDFSKSKLYDFVYLETACFNDQAKLAFGNAVADKILVGREQLEGRLASEHAGDHAGAAQELGLLKRNFEGLHRYDDEDWAFYRFKVNQRRARPTSWSKPWTKMKRLLELVFLDYGCGYGVNPFRAVASAVVLMVVFGLVYAWDIGRFSVEQPPFADQPITSVANRVTFGMMTSVSVFTAGFTGEHLTTTHGWMLAPVTIEALVGTLLWGLFIVAFSRKVIR